MVTKQDFRQSRREMRIFENFENFEISTVDSGKTVAGIKKSKPDLSSRARNLQENVTS